MATVLIAEDEYLVRVGLRTCIDWESCGLTLLDDAVNGEDAYQKIRSYRPDILLLDIKMPKMDGFTLLARLMEEHIPVHVIILSGCDDFESVRTALQYGVLDYLNKLTLTPSELFRVLRKVPYLPSNAHREQTVDSPPAAAAPNSVFRKILFEKTCDPAEQSCLFPSGYVLCVYTAPKADGAAVSSSLLANMTCQQLKNSHVEYIAQCDPSDMVTLLIPCTQDPKAAAATLYRQLHVTLDTMCAIGYSGRYRHPDEIYMQYLNARQIQDSAYWCFGGGVRFFDRQLSPSEDCAALISRSSKIIQDCLRLRDLRSTLRQIDALCQTLQEREDLTRDSYIHQLLSLLSLFPREGLETYYFTAQKQMVASETWLAAKGALAAYVAQFCKESGFQTSSYSPIVAKAIRCIMEHPGQILSLSEAARCVNASESYLSQLFKKETGENYNSFVHRYKISQAKEMLRDNLLVYEVCDRLGYENANYFAKLFRRYTGLTPNQYKKKLKDTEG